MRTLKSVLITVMMVMVWSGSVAVYAQNIEVKCGDVIEGEFTENAQQIEYPITLSAGDVITIRGSVFGDYLTFNLGIRSPTGTWAAIFGSANSYEELAPSERSSAPDPSITTSVLSASGRYVIAVRSEDREGIGAYTIEISCTLRDGTVIEPGDTAPAGGNDNNTIPPPSSFNGYGFPGAPAIDFSQGIEIPIQPGQLQTAPISGDTIAVYTYDAMANSTSILSISRVSGDLSVGVAVINKTDNSIVFLGGMPTSNNLSVELTFPTDGIYSIGLFRLDTANATGTSGAVQISIQ